MSKKKIVAIIILALLILSLPILIFYLLCYETRLAYGFQKVVTDDNIKYGCSAVTNVCTVSSVTLDPNVEKVEISIPDKLTDGTLVEGIGYITKGKDFFDIKIEGTKLEYSGLEDENQNVTDYFVTLRLGKNIKIANCLLDLNEIIYQVKNTDEYIRINITYEVSPDNRWYYSENGKLYEKDDAGFFESTRTYRVWEARMED